MIGQGDMMSGKAYAKTIFQNIKRAVNARCCLNIRRAASRSSLIGHKTGGLPLVFILSQIVLYLAFLYLDITGGDPRISAGMKYMVVILCFCYALLSGSEGGGIVFSIQAGLFFTLIADLFILLLDLYFYGVLAFIIVQQLYGFRLLLVREELQGAKTGRNQSGRSRHMLFRFLRRLLLSLVLSAVICIVLTEAGVVMEALIIVSVFYFISILMNTVSAVRLACRRERQGRSRDLMYAVGMFLFLLCDINVGLFNLSGFIEVSREVYSIIYGISSILMWTFYAPSQVLIALSSSNRGGLSRQNY